MTASSRAPLKYLQAYPQALQDQVQQLIDQGRLAAYLEQRYPRGIRSRATRRCMPTLWP